MPSHLLPKRIVTPAMQSASAPAASASPHQSPNPNSIQPAAKPIMPSTIALAGV